MDLNSAWYSMTSLMDAVARMALKRVRWWRHLLGEDGFDDGFLGDGFARFGRVFALGLEVIDVEVRDVPVLNAVGESIYGCHPSCEINSQLVISYYCIKIKTRLFPRSVQGFINNS